MELNNKKYCLEAYGLFRMVLGIAQIAGLFSAYFLLEFIVDYPKEAFFYVIDENVIALVYLAILFRGIFHLTSGIGIARCKNWVKVWLYCGWALMGIITYGLIFTLCGKWIEMGYISQMVEVIFPVRSIAYLVIILFDLSFICKTVSLLEGEYFGYHDKGPRLEFQKIFILGFVIVLFFSLLLYLGKPISKGFHKGYYKTRGDSYKKKPAGVKTTSEVKNSSSAPLRNVDKYKKRLRTEIESESNRRTKATFFGISEEPKTQNQDDSRGHSLSGVARENGQAVTSEKSFPYQSMIGYAGSFCLAVAFLLQAFNASGLKTLNNQPLISFVLFCVGFVFLFVYGISLKLTPITILSLLSFLICLVIVCLQIRSYDYF